MKKVLIIASLSLLYIGCQKQETLKSYDWRGQGEAPQIPKTVSFKSSTLKAGTRSIDFSEQTYQGLPVEDAYVKKISGQNGAEFVSARYYEDVGLKVKTDIFLMKPQRNFVLNRLAGQMPDFNQYRLVGEPELFIRTKPTPSVMWRIALEAKNGVVSRYLLDRYMHLRAIEPLGSNLTEALATLFPNGPIHSSLKNVVLKNLVSVTLDSPVVEVSSRSPSQATAENDRFLYPVEDVRFHQVQAYFYATQAVSWVASTYMFNLPFKLNVDTSVGYPDKTNAAFYFDKTIRLGDGDDEVFSKIPLDPSIVTHETMHAVIDSVSHLSFEREGGSINEGLADYFTAVQLKNPNLGEASYKKAPFKRTVANAMAFSEKTGGLYHDSGIISGLLWNLQQELGEDFAKTLAWNILLRLGPASDFAQFKTEVLDLVSKEEASVKNHAELILKARGWM